MTHADRLVSEALELEGLLLSTSKEGSFHKFYSSLNKYDSRSSSPSFSASGTPKGGSSSSSSSSSRRRSSGGSAGGRRRSSSSGSGAIGLLLQKAVKLSALSGIVHETELNRQRDTTASPTTMGTTEQQAQQQHQQHQQQPMPAGAFRCEECHFINASLRLQCKQCRHHRFPLFSKSQLAVLQLGMMQASISTAEAAVCLRHACMHMWLECTGACVRSRLGRGADGWGALRFLCRRGGG
jgi:hypothetical protein